MPTPAPAASVMTATDIAAWIALGLSVLGIVISVVLRYLDGPRMRIRLRAVLLDVGMGPTTTYDKGAWPIPAADRQRSRALPASGDVVELAEIVVENEGRHAMTVYDVGFAWKGVRRKWWRRRIRHSIVPTPILPQQADEQKYSNGDRFRVEPADMLNLLVDYWGIVRRSRPNRRGVLKLRAYARVAGRRRPKRSSVRLQWVIPDTAHTAIGGARKVPLRTVIARNVSLVLFWTTKDRPMNVAYLARDLEAHIGGVWPSDFRAQVDLLKAFFDEKSQHHLAFYDQDRMLGATLAFGLSQDIELWKDAIDWTDIRVKSGEQFAPETESSRLSLQESSNARRARRVRRDVGPPDPLPILADSVTPEEQPESPPAPN